MKKRPITRLQARRAAAAVKLAKASRRSASASERAAAAIASTRARYLGRFG